jgi:hypothetical protein
MNDRQPVSPSEQPHDTIRLTVRINGTDTNPWARYGLRQNPFPQVAKHELLAGERMLASLDGEPVTTTQDIRDRLAGCSAELIELCIAQWRPGERVEFDIVFPRYRE